jgi:membrane protein insertase Oxa1/YidC/SpoIIIJ
VRLSLDAVLISTLLLFAVSGVIFYWFFRFTVNLIKQHNNVYPLLYELEEAEKKKEKGEKS